MTVRADRKYNGTVLDESKMITSQSGTLGFQIYLECEDGTIGHVIWLTPNTKERALETFAMLGVDESKLRDATYVEKYLAGDIAGRPVSFTTVEETYKDKTRVKVGFINKRNAAVYGGSPSQAAAVFFGGQKTQAAQAPAPHAGEITDEDIPFRYKQPQQRSNDWYETMPPMPRVKASGSILRSCRNG